MKKYLLPVAAVAVIAIAVSAKQSVNPDATLLTVNGKDIPVSEFEYLYNKNNNQQIERQTPEEYLEMFINYKLKVADAEAQGIDTTKAFKNELEQHRMELAKPYLKDADVENALINDIYSHMDRLVDVSHVMLRKGSTPEQNDSVKHMLDSIRTLIVSGKETLEDMALKYSIDPQAKRNKGRMGWMKANTYPYTFENVAYATPEGEISQVMETPFGFHIIKVHGFKPNPGRVNASHILKMTMGLDSLTQLKKKAQMDSIYEVVKNGDAAVFAEVAKMESEDPGSRQNGGKLSWFGAGEMVPEFESVAFSLSDGEVSRPFATRFGYHIIMRHAHRGIPSLEEEKEAILRNMWRDDRRDMAQKAKLESYLTSQKASVDEKGVAKVYKALSKDSVMDSVAYARVAGMTKVSVAKIGKQRIYASEIAASLAPDSKMTPAAWMAMFEARIQSAMDAKATEMMIAELPEKYDDYKNILNEYRDGILLFEVSNRNVWDKALRDTEGLEKYFQAHKDEYKWDKPHYKGTIIFTTGPAVTAEIQEFLSTYQGQAANLPAVIKQKYDRRAKAERVLAAEGDNAIVDNVAFGGVRPDTSKSRWTDYFAYEGTILSQPQSAQDVKGLVTTDYQQVLEQEWVKQLREKYPVVVNTKVFDKIK
ncbi:MAG: hypothetical protein C7K11_06220 [Candidatus Amulumruptor caecigallinarius]|uniref:Peptidylprolyl isomerase n=1 Tax=Candidatus Amulumruptor caecigallinarius TaxID=2109911 RepID=A0A4Q0U8C8_9BACT|nr:MAG: hypothetical protein C7K11_06220 [Candidatus Amulumruptor caecigallinarius]HJE38682.1 peptidylprolyl isomerase [Candidatus Amulumruptor caecigallinarius]